MKRDRRLGVFAKYWSAGHVKTRLAARIGPESAARCYRLWLQFLLDRFQDTGDRRQLMIWPRGRLSAFDQLSGNRWDVAGQAEGDLGRKMQHFFESAGSGASDRGPRSVLIGSDSPTLPVGLIEEAWERLADVPVVLGPAVDGGYYLIGLRHEGGELPPIFDAMPWSTPGLWQATCNRLDQAGIPYHALSPWYDVDDFDDLVRLRNELRAFEPSLQADSQANPLLAELDRLPPCASDANTSSEPS